MKEVIFTVCSNGVVTTNNETQQPHEDMDLENFMMMLNKTVSSGEEIKTN